MTTDNTIAQSTQASCRECGEQLDAGYLCDQCDIVEVVSA